MSLEKDNPKHRNFSNNLDAKFSGKALYDKAVRPIMHGVYHAGRSATSLNSAEWARAKDQFCTVGTGQSQTDYLKAHQEAAKKAAE